MSLNAAPRHVRKKIIKQHRVTKTLDQLAEMCHCTPRTIDRDIAEMKASGEWLEFLEHAMLHYGQKDTVSDTAKFNKYADMYAKAAITAKMRQTTALEGTVKLDHDVTGILDQYADVFERIATRTFHLDDPEEPVDT